LLEFETLSGDEIQQILDGGTINRSNDDTPNPNSPPRRRSVPRSKPVVQPVV
jgi:hypothetical protein